MSFRKAGAGRLLKRLNQALPPSLAVAARSGLASTKDTAIAKPKISDHSTEWIMPRGTATRAVGLLRGVGGGVEGGDGVGWIERADQECDEGRARLRHVAAGLASVVHEGEQPRKVPAGAPDEEHQRQHHRDHQDQVAGEVGQRGGDADAGMVEGRLRQRDQRDADHLLLIAPGRDVAVEDAAPDEVLEQRADAEIDRGHHEDQASRLTQAVAQPQPRPPRIEDRGSRTSDRGRRRSDRPSRSGRARRRPSARRRRR